MEVRIDHSIKYSDRLSYHHIKNIKSSQERYKITTYGYSFKQAIKHGIPIRAGELYDDALVRFTDGENCLFRLYMHGFDCKIYTNGDVRYRFGDIKHLLPERDVKWIRSEVRRLRTELGKKYKEEYKK